MADNSDDDDLEVLSPNTLDQAYHQAQANASFNKRPREDEDENEKVVELTPAAEQANTTKGDDKKDDKDACVFVTCHRQGLSGNPCDTSAHGVVTCKSCIPDKNGSGAFDNIKMTWRLSYDDMNVVISVTSDRIPPEQDSIDPFMRRLAVGLMGGCCEDDEKDEELDNDDSCKRNVTTPPPPFKVFEWCEKEWLTKALDPSTHKCEIHIEIIDEDDECDE